MECAEVRAWLYRRIDDELSEPEIRVFDNHVARCPSCAREYALLIFPRRIASEISPVTPSPFFFGKLRHCIDSEKQGMARLQLFQRLARRMIPALAGITLALITAFAYLQLRSPKVDIYQDYRGVFLTEEPSHRMLAGEQGDITDASVLNAIAEKQSGY